jgi:hypothetical protein
MTYAEIWKKACESTQPADINNRTKAESADIEKVAKTFGKHMKFTNATDGHVIIRFSDGSIFNPVTGNVECPFGHSPRGQVWGGDAIRHSCGCPVLKGEKRV